MQTPSFWRASPLVIIAFLILASRSHSQSADSVGSPQISVFLAKLSDPVFPPLAKAARVSGDVIVRVSVQTDGTVRSVDIVSGPAMLVQAAKLSAEKSQFECRGCTVGTREYPLTYSFRLSEGDCEQASSVPPKISWEQGHITVVASPALICDPISTISRVRSAKCLYLWRCGIR